MGLELGLSVRAGNEEVDVVNICVVVAAMEKNTYKKSE